MEKDQVNAKVTELTKALEGITTSEMVVVVDALFTSQPRLLQAAIGAIWHIGECMNAGKAEIKPTKTGIGLNFVAKRGQSLDLPKGR